MLKRISKKYCIYLYTFKPCIFIELWCKSNLKYKFKINKKINVYIDQLLCFVLKCQCKNKYFASIPLNPAYLLNYGVKSQYSH